MELDICSLLNSATSDSSFNTDDDAPHRTIDDIFNDCDSSSSLTSPPSSPFDSLFSLTNSYPQPHSSTKTAPTRTRFNFSVQTTRMRSNAKSGAVLAAATTASQSVPTPHATTIISRRCGVILLFLATIPLSP
ncbi:hypothetical protein PHAVU_011G172900 [Phaseolus vulgaris]|uniref:Uncharacterized protein n=1 Tax=Phaseolus vulgaris TaxID=3885 RepID=V7AIC9_PHAVU|nr:hypothetical protein PHAVU_011G172900g [Phaseolus vulgaris]ESW05357.1 hypothetical protein PHAVU_011G172900g [Phaseolus vulgaris]